MVIKQELGAATDAIISKMLWTGTGKGPAWHKELLTELTISSGVELNWIEQYCYCYRSELFHSEFVIFRMGIWSGQFVWNIHKYILLSIHFGTSLSLQDTLCARVLRRFNEWSYFQFSINRTTFNWRKPNSTRIQKHWITLKPKQTDWT